MKFWLSVLLPPRPILVGNGYTADDWRMPIVWNVEGGFKKVDVNCHGIISSFVVGTYYCIGIGSH